MGDKFNFTMARLRAIMPPEKGRVTIRDTGCPGLAIRVTSNGTMTAVIDRKHGGRHIRLRLGAWPTDFGTVLRLRGAARKVLGDFGKAVRSRRAAQDEPTLADLWEMWQRYAAENKKPKSAAEDARYWGRFLRPWENRRVSEISRSNITTLHARVGRENGRYTANRMLEVIKAMYNRARREGLWEGENPAADVQAYPEKSRDRFFSHAELATLFDALRVELPLFRDYFLLLLLTGGRKSNVLQMKWEQIDWDLGYWRIPETKNAEPVIVPLVGPAMEILAERRRRANGEPWVFPSPRAKGKPLNDPKAAWKRICRNAGLVDARVHDLRRTLASHMTIGGTSLPIVGKALGHKTPTATAIYARLSTEPVREGMHKATASMLAAADVKLLENKGVGDGEA